MNYRNEPKGLVWLEPGVQERTRLEKSQKVGSVSGSLVNPANKLLDDHSKI